MTNKKNKNHKKQQNNYPAPKVIVDQQQLMNQCLSLHELLQNRTKLLRQLKTDDLCYILSTKWLADWKQYVGYEQLTGDNSQKQTKKDKKYGKRHPGKINTEIIASAAQIKQFYKIPEEMTQYLFMNELISEKKVKDEDYIAITKQIWQAFLAYYEGQLIRKPVLKQKGSFYYDSQPLNCDVILANLEQQDLEERIKKTNRRNYNSVFNSLKMAIPTIWNLEQLIQFIAEFCGVTFGTSKIKIWKGASYIATNPTIQALVQSIKQRKFILNARQITIDRYQGMMIDKYLKSTYTLIVEIGEATLKTGKIQQQIKGYCEECVQKKELTIACMCDQVVYCSQKCRVNDQNFHYNTCKQAFDSQDDEEYQKEVKDKINLAGLDNIGNTCYMNSVIQGLLGFDHIRKFFLSNEYKSYMNEEELKNNNCMLLKKFSKTIKGLVQSEKSYTPWSLKSQIDYNLPPFRGDKQHDANDFLLNFLNTLNDYLKKQGDSAYHQILSFFVGQFHSKVICPHCKTVNENNEIFMQISLPIKAKTNQKTFNYTVAQSLTLIRRGKTSVAESWSQIKKNIHAENSIACIGKGTTGITVIDQQQTQPQALLKGKGDLIFYKNIQFSEGDEPFIFGLVSTKVICGSKMKSPYGIPILLYVNHIQKTLGTFWIQVIKHFFSSKEQIVIQAEQIQRQYFVLIENIIKQESKIEEQATESEAKVEEKESPQSQKVVKEYNQKLKLFAEKIGIEIYVLDLKKNRNVCRYCNKKCNNCDLPQKFDEPFEDYFDDKYKQVKFEVFLREILQIEYIQQDKCIVGDPTIQNCIELFSEPEQLDEENAWYCADCDSMGLALKQLHIRTYPPLLILHLNRFKTVNDKKMKNSDPITYSQIQMFGNKEYKLIGVVIHEGSMDAGHYWSIGLREDKYYIFNDSKVTQVDKVFNRNAYILLYSSVQFKG